MQRPHCTPRCAALITLTLFLAGCQTYSPMPLDLQQRAAEWAQRSLDDPAIAQLAARFPDTAEGEARRRTSGIEDQWPYDPADGLSLREAEPVALVFSPDLRAQRLRAQVPLAGAEFAGLWDDPELDGDLLRFLNSMDDPWILGLGISFTVPLSGRLRVEEDQAWAEAEHAWLTAAKSEWELLEALRVKWIDWSALEWRVRILDDYLAELTPLAESVSRLVEVGEVDPASARLLEIDRVRRTFERARLASQEERARLELLTLMGLTAEADIELIPVSLWDEGTHVPDISEIEAFAAHPDARLAQAAYDRAELALDREIVKQYPDLTIGPRFEDEEGQSRLGLGFGLPLPLWNRNHRGIAEALAQRDAAAAEVDAVLQRLRAEFHATSVTWEAASDLAFQTPRLLWPLVEAQLEELRGLAELGEVDVLLLREALAGVVEAELAAVDAMQARAEAAARIESIANPRWAVPQPVHPEE
ncbi:TolC family protein [Phycisphaeraceae bacterium D3-23]